MASLLKRDYRLLLAILRPVNHATRPSQHFDQYCRRCRSLTTNAQSTSRFSVSFGDPKIDAAFAAAHDGKAQPLKKKQRGQKKKKAEQAESPLLGGVEKDSSSAGGGGPEVQPLIPQIVQINRPKPSTRDDVDVPEIEIKSGSHSDEVTTVEPSPRHESLHSSSSSISEKDALDIRPNSRSRRNQSQSIPTRRSSAGQSANTRTIPHLPATERIISERASPEPEKSRQMRSTALGDEEGLSQDTAKKLAPWQIKTARRLQKKAEREDVDKRENLRIAEEILEEARNQDPRYEGIEQNNDKPIKKGSDEAPRISEPKLKREEEWQIQKDALQRKFGETSWNPRKKVSPDAMEGIRSLHQSDPETYNTALLSQQFKISPEAVRRILKSKWRPSDDIIQDRRERWAKRHDRIWDMKAALGLLPPRRKTKEIEPPEKFEEEYRRERLLEAAAANA